MVDRLGMGRGPYTTVVRGGLRKNYIAVRIRSTYNIPVSVNIYVGCENKAPSTMRQLAFPTVAIADTESVTDDEIGSGEEEETTTIEPEGG